MATEVIMYKSIAGKVFDTVEQAQEADYQHKVKQIISSTDGWLETSYPSQEGILKEILIQIRNQFGKLTKSELQVMINHVSELVDEEENY